MPDLRNTHKGGWSYVEHELYSVFVPLIGPLGGMVYAAMSRLIPRFDVDPDYPVTVGSTSRESQVKRATCGEKMREIVALGMVLEKKAKIKNRPSTYTLVPLRELALVGIEELERRSVAEIGWVEFRKRLFDRLDEEELESRFGVHWADTTEEQVFPKASLDPAMEDAQGPSGADHAPEGGSTVDQPASTSPAASATNGVRGVDTEADPASTEQIAGEEADRCPPGGRASTETASVSATEASVSTLGGYRISALRKEEESEIRTNNNFPLPPQAGESELILPFSDVRHGDPGFALSVGVAARWVMAECGTVPGLRSNKRVEVAIDGALTQRAKQTRQELEELARMAVTNWTEYTANRHLLRFPVHHLAKFFERSLWYDKNAWTWDREKLAQQAARTAASVGRNEAVREEPAEQLWRAVCDEVYRRTKQENGQPSHEWIVFAIHIKPARLVKLKRDGGIERWTLASANQQVAVDALLELDEVLQAAVREIAGCGVTFDVVST